MDLTKIKLTQTEKSTGAVEILKDISDRWNFLERRLKALEKTQMEVEVPAINELRYAGRKIVDAVIHASKGEEEKFFDCITVARQYCLNADHDITDGVCEYFERKFRLLIERYGYSNLLQYLSEFDKVYTSLKNANKHIEDSREYRVKTGDNGNHREEIYNKIRDEIVPELIAYHDRVIASQDIMELERMQRIRRERAQKIALWIGIMSGIIGIGTFIAAFFI